MLNMIHSRQVILPITISCCILLAGSCSPSHVTVPASTTLPATETISPISTDTLVPAATSTVKPSATPDPTLTFTPLVSDLGQVIVGEGFDDLTFQLKFDYWGPAQIESGVIMLEREAGYKSPPGLWPYGGINTLHPVAPGTTTLVLFQVKNGATFNIGYHTGNYGEDSLRRFTYNSGQGTWDWYYGNPTANGNYPIKQWRARPVNLGVWHYFMIKRSSNGDVEAKLWERDHPATMIQFHENLGPEWGTLELSFFIDYHKGTLFLDEYQNLQ